ncbi:MAG: hypothetical protein HOK30_23305 [Rhodospirillaceae bacterium]|jgi:hypothetical protein|nr:hypothetical protein [Rhodospirillaceae bacterium]MBT5192956.1 hypothetical protein [Rhodospirillaceae bacterium]MBT6430616.1 hypothetical protein [Rhodospirillaceae bacterium]MBT7757785.1 hypothetical protein [Rhodospirillaceae bacterium]
MNLQDADLTAISKPNAGNIAAGRASDCIATERRSVALADADWQDACGNAATPDLKELGIGDSAGDWHDRFLIRSDEHMPHAVFIACGNTLQSGWDMQRLGATVEDVVPGALQEHFAEGCRRSLENSAPVPLEGSFMDSTNAEVVYRCVMMPVRPLNDDVIFIYGAYSQKHAA